VARKFLDCLSQVLFVGKHGFSICGARARIRDFLALGLG